MNHRAIRRMWSLVPAVVCLCLCFSAAAFAQDDVPPDFEIVTSGEKILNTDVYSSRVAIDIKPRQTDGVSVMIKENGLWMRILPNENGLYHISFNSDGDYTRQFCLEDKEGQRGPIQEISFTVDSGAASAMAEIDKLPSADSPQEDIGKAKDAILSAQKKIANLRMEQSARIPQGKMEKLEKLLESLQKASSTDILPPQPPVISVSGTKSSISELYNGAVEISVKPAEGSDTQAIYVRIYDEWAKMAPDAAGNYTLKLEEAQEYAVDFCAEDKGGNRSTTAGARFAINSKVFNLIYQISELSQLYEKAKDCTGAEEVLRAYQDLTPQERDLLPREMAQEVEEIYKAALRWLGYKDTVMFDNDTYYVQAIGLMRGIAPPDLASGEKYSISFFASKSAPDPGIKTPAGKKLLEQYQIGVQYQINGSNPRTQEADILNHKTLKIRIQVPPELRGRKNVGVFCVNDKNNPEDMQARVKNMDDGLILEFYTNEAGAFVVTETPAEDSSSSSGSSSSSSGSSSSSSGSSSSSSESSSSSSGSSSSSSGSSSSSSGSSSSSSESSSSSSESSSSSDSNDESEENESSDEDDD